jgi:hypothetical protein
MRFLIFDDLTMDFMDLKIERNSHCPVYGNHPTVTELIDYELSGRLWPSNVMMTLGHDGNGKHLSQGHDVIGDAFGHGGCHLFPLLRGARTLGPDWLR